MGETLQYSAQLVDALTPVLDRIVEALNNLTAVMTKVGEQISAAFDAGSGSAEAYGNVLIETMGDVDVFNAAIQENTDLLIEQTNFIQENTTVILENADAKTANADAQNASNASLKEGSGNLMQMGMVLGAATGALIYMGAKAQDTFNLIQVFTGSSQQQMQSYESAIDQMALTFGKTTNDMAQGLYDIVSVGYQGADALNILNASAMAASAGEVDLHTVTNGLTAILQAYSLNAQQASDVTDLLMMGVRDGKSDFGDFANSFSLVATTAHGAGFGLNDAAAALSTLTLVFPDAQRAGEDLNFLMRAIGINVGQTADTARKLGLQFDETKFSSMSLYDRLQYLMQITSGNQDEMLKLTGGAAGYAAAQVLLTNNGQTFSHILDDMANKSGLTAQAFATHSDTMSMHAGRLMASLSVLADHFQELSAPFINAAMDTLGKVFAQMATFMEQHGQLMIPILAALAVVIGGVLVGALYGLASGFLAAIAAALPVVAPIAAVVGVIALLAVGLKNAYDHSKPFRDAVQAMGDVLGAVKDNATTLWNVLSNHLAPIFRQLGETIQTNIMPIWHDFQKGLETVAGWLNQLAQHLEATSKNTAGFQDVLSKIGGVFKDVWSLLQPLIQTLQAQLGPVLNTIKQVVAQDLLPAWNSLQSSFNAILPVLKFVGEIILGVLVVAFIEMYGVVKGVLSALGPIISGIAMVIGGLVDVIAGQIKMVVSIISGVFNILKDIFTGNFKQLGPDLKNMLSGVMDGLAEVFKGAWEVIKGIFVGAVGGILAYLGGFFSGIIHFFQDTWDKVTTGVKNFFVGIGHAISQGVQSVLRFFQQLGANILVTIHNAWNAITGAFQTAINFIVGLFQWLYNHNYYFKDLVDAIAAAFQWIQKTASDIWNAITSALGDAWKAIQDAAKTAWDWVKQHIITPLQEAWNTVVGIGGQIISALESAWSTVVSDVQGAWNSFVGTITGLWNTITTAIHDNVVQPIEDAINGVVSWAYNAASNFINMLVQGIKDGVGKIWDAVKGVANTIWQALGFHSPPEAGPLADSDEYMPNMMSMYAKTMLATLPAIEQATNTVATRIRTGLTQKLSPELGISGVGAGTPLTPVAGGSYGTGDIRELHIHIDAHGQFRDGMALMNGAAQDRFARQIADALAKRKSIQVIGNYGYSGT